MKNTKQTNKKPLCKFPPSTNHTVYTKKGIENATLFTTISLKPDPTTLIYMTSYSPMN